MSRCRLIGEPEQIVDQATRTILSSTRTGVVVEEHPCDNNHSNPFPPNDIIVAVVIIQTLRSTLLRIDQKALSQLASRYEIFVVLRLFV
jgi:hypothetical protein